MIGYSDSNKDVGYVASGWAAYRAQTRHRRGAARARRALGRSFTAAAARSGAAAGPTNGAILALPPGTVEGRLKMTEQGEVLAAKYSVPEIAHRELELAAERHARRRRPLTASRAPSGRCSSGCSSEMAARLAPRCTASSSTTIPTSRASSTPSTPIEEISRLRLGSRPARRGGGRRHRGPARDPLGVLLDAGAHRRCRPGSGWAAALGQARASVTGSRCCSEMDRDWPFFAALLANAEMAWPRPTWRSRSATPSCGRTRRRASGSGRADRAEFERTHERAVGGSRRASACSTASRCCRPRSIAATRTSTRSRSSRSSCCAGCAPRRRASRGARRVSLLTINGIAGGLRNTG